MIDKDNVADILEIANTYSINKLKTYCSEFLEKNLKASNCLNVIELAEKYHLVDLSKQTLAYIHKHFEHIIQYHELEKKSLSDVQHYINRAWYFPSELVLRLITRWVNQHSSREDQFVNLLHNVNWNTLDPGFISRHLDNDMLYPASPEALLTILHFLDKNNVKLSSRHAEMYRDLQDKLLPNNELEQELDDSTSFLSIAINSAVMKDLEHSEVDETFSSYILQTEPIGDSNQYGPYRHPSGNDIETYKNESEVQNSPEVIQFHSSFRKSSSPLNDEDGTGSAEINKPQIDTRLPDTNQNLAMIKMTPEPVYYLPQDTRSCRAEMKTTNPPEPCQQHIPNLHYSMQSPSSSEANLGFRNPPLDSCDEVYKNYSSQTSEMGDAFYRQQSSYGIKPIQTFANSDIRYMQQYTQDPVVSDSSFNTDLFKNDINLYREDSRNPNYICPMFREGTMYPTDIDNYRTICSNQTYDNFKLEGENVLERSEYSTYKDDANNEIRTPPSEVSAVRPEKIDRMNSSRSDFDFSEYQILEQVINEQRLCEKSSTATKRYDPKFRALAEAFKQTEPDLNSQVSNQDMFDYKAGETGSDDKSLRENFGNCRISEKNIPKERLDCQYEEEIHLKPAGYVHIHIPCSDSQFSRSEDLIEHCQDTGPSSGGCGDQDILQFQNSETTSYPDQEENRENYPDSVLETPPKKILEGETASKAKSSVKSAVQQIVLTPKEKYAKEINAERKLESVIKNVFPTEVQLKSEEPTIPEPEPELPLAPVEDKVQAPKKVPLALKIFRAKKKMFIQKKLILEHGEVRLTQKQRIKLKPIRKRLLKLAAGSHSLDSQGTKPAPEVSEKQATAKRIVNRKDKLLAEHRRKQVLPEPSNRNKLEPLSKEVELDPLGSGMTINLEDLVIQIELTCPFCDYLCVEKKDYYKHIKVRF